MNKIVAQLDHYGYFVGPTVADESPLEPGVFLLPARAVDIQLPSVPVGMRARLVDGAWQFEPATAQAAGQHPGGGLEEGVPYEVSAFQAKAAMLEANILSQVQAFIDQPSTEPLVKLAWNTVQVFRRNSLMVMAVAIELEMTNEQLDALFVRADQIVV